jgi:ADP-ribose pyrophosphatase YjhB (NUDIX family)/ribosomal protein S18 acetylase RimI-like enzyme
VTDDVRQLGAKALGDPALRHGVVELVRSAVADGAALGWVEPPAPQALQELLDDVTACARSGDAGAVVLAAGDEVLAFGYWRRYARPTHQPHADIERVVVAPPVRGRGHGRRVLRALVGSAAAAGVEVLTLDVRGDNAGAIGLYASEGFTEHGRLRGFVAVGNRRWDKVLMSRRLSGEAPSADVVEVTDHLVGWAVLQRDDGQVLLARRARVSYASGSWGLPGGHVDDDETLAQGTARELLEEVGVTASPADLEPLGVTRYVDGPHRGTDFFFRVRRWDGEPTATSECSQVAWFEPGRLPPDALPWLGAALRTHLLDGAWLADHPSP